MIRLKEAVPFRKADVVSKQLQKTDLPTLTPNTFGIELEYDPGPQPESINVEDYSEEIVQNMLSARNWRTNRDEYAEWLNGKRERVNRRYGQYGREWDDSYGPVDVETWDGQNPEPSVNSFSGTTDSEDEDTDAYNTAHKEWSDARNDVEYEYTQWERGRRWDSNSEEWANDMISNGEWQDYSDISLESLAGGSNEEGDINEARWFIKERIGDLAVGKEGSINSWGVGMDGNYVEIRSKHLTESEMDKVRTILSFVRSKKTDGDTSAHVHVGLPTKFDAFDIISMSDLVDESEITKAIKGDRDYHSWARLNYDLAGDLLRAINDYFKKTIEKSREYTTTKVIETGWVIKLDTLNGILKDKMLKMRGTNLASFFDHGTIEFRYWSSEAAVADPENFIKWIRYFMLLPKVAQKRKKIIIGPGRMDSLVLSRQGTSHVKIEFEEDFKNRILKNYYERRMRDRNQMQFDFR